MADNDEIYLEFEESLEKFEKNLFRKYREKLRDYLKNDDMDIYHITDGNLLSSLVLIRSFESQEQLNKLTKVLIIFTLTLVVFTIVLAFLTYLLYLKG